MNRRAGFTLVEVMIAAGILGALTTVIAMLILRTVDTYGQVTSDTDAIKQTRQSLNMIAREMRESITVEMRDPGAGAPLGTIQDAMLFTSARDSGNNFVIDADFVPAGGSITLFYMNTVSGVPQLARLHLFYVEDLGGYTPPFFFPAGSPYSGSDIIIVDSTGAQINIDRTTGAVGGGGPPFAMRPNVLMNRVTSFDVVAGAPVEVRITCQVVDRYGRTATSRVRTQIDLRNI